MLSVHYLWQWKWVQTFTSKPYVSHLWTSASQPVSRTHKQTYTGASASGHYHNTLHYWTRHGQYSRAQWHWCVPNRCSMGHSFNLPYSTICLTRGNLPYSTESLPRCSNFWLGHAVWHPLLTDWNKIGDHRQCQTDFNMEHENCSFHDWDNKIDDKVLLRNDGSLHKSETQNEVILGLSHQFVQMGQSGLMRNKIRTIEH